MWVLRGSGFLLPSLSESNRLSFWDSLIVIAAKRCGAKTLYTQDLNRGQRIDGVEIVNPFD
jgi:predicted nucleic acid-binding protein